MYKRQDECFAGAIDLKDLITAREGMNLESIIAHSYPYVLDLSLIHISDLKCIPELLAMNNTSYFTAQQATIVVVGLGAFALFLVADVYKRQVLSNWDMDSH